MFSSLRLGLVVSVFLSRDAIVLAQQSALGVASLSESRSEAAQESAPVIELRELIEEAVERNPELQAARYRYEAATKRPSQVGSLPDPKINVTNFGVGRPLGGLNRSDFAYNGIGVSQEIPFPGKLALAEEEATKEAQSERENYRSLQLDLTARLKTAYYEWFGVTKAIETTRKNRRLMERLEEIARARYSVGKGIQQDVLKAQVEISSLAQQLELLNQRRESLEAQLKLLLSRQQDAPFGRPAEVKPTPFSMDLKEVLAAVDANSPRIRAMQLMVDSRAVGVNRSQKELRPDFNLSFQWQRTGTQYPDYYMATAEVRLPLYFWRKQTYGIEEAHARLQESRHNYRSARQEAQFLAKDQYLIAKTSERVLALYQSGIGPQSSLSLESAIAGYQVGSVDFLTLVNNATSLIGFERQYYEELARHEQALARLEALLGQELSRP
jgi:outer membrane protein TolC